MFKRVEIVKEIVLYHEFTLGPVHGDRHPAPQYTYGLAGGDGSGGGVGFCFL